ncbi:MAG: SUMF1/EgtB/PvdO family nonheme iron enzyme, partial [Calditrichaeota bacterium]|nr:SUMF1/EgtB/PvdO family nonheme iron enzyme [Calditrichota bacterium]
MKIKVLIIFLLFHCCYTSVFAQNRSVEFDGHVDNVEIASNQLLNMGSENFTLECWFKGVSANISASALAIRYGGGRADYGLVLMRAGYVIMYCSGDNGSFQEGNLNVRVTDRQWHHAAVTRTGNSFTLLIDGNVVRTVNSAVGSINSGNPLVIGNHLRYRDSFEGLIDEIRLWRIGLSSDQIRESMNTEIDPESEGLLGYWRCNDQVEGEIIDLTGNGNNGRLGDDAHLVEEGSPVDEFHALQDLINIEIVSVEQLHHPSKVVQVQYSYYHRFSLPSQTSMLVSDNTGESWDVQVNNVWGDIGSNIHPGHNKIIYWNAGRDYPNQVTNQMKVRITADDSEMMNRAGGTERTFELIDGVEIEMVWIPPGEFMMGSPNNEEGRHEREGPAHRVSINYGFWMGKYEVTQLQWESVMGRNPAHDYGVGDDYPIYFVSWDDIQNFEEELGNTFRLPSESEWEYAARADTITRWSFGDRDSDLDEHGWHAGNSGASTREVGQKKAN